MLLGTFAKASFALECPMGWLRLPAALLPASIVDWSLPLLADTSSPLTIGRHSLNALLTFLTCLIAIFPEDLN